MKKTLFILTIFTLISYAKMLDRIAIIVEDQAITTKEIQVVQQQLRVSKSAAENLLIANRLEHVAISKIKIDETIVDDRIGKIAAQNRVSVAKMKKVIKAKGTSWKKYRKTVINSLKREKFFQTNLAPALPTPNESELKLYYKKNRGKFNGGFTKAKPFVERAWKEAEQKRMIGEYFKKMRTSVKITRLR